MDYREYLDRLRARFDTPDKLRNHIASTLSNRDQRVANYDRLPQNYPIAGVLLALTIPKIVVERQFNPIDHLHIIYEKRSNKMKNHPGQMAFPGGTLEDKDNASVKNAAFREANEEIGINPADLEFIAFMDEFVASSNILVQPVVSWLEEDLPVENFHQSVSNRYFPRTKESTATVVMPLTHLLNPEYYRSKPYHRNGSHVGFVRYFDTGEIRKDDTIWGLTASMTRRFLNEVFPDNPLPSEPLLKEQ